MLSGLHGLTHLPMMTSFRLEEMNATYPPSVVEGVEERAQPWGERSERREEKRRCGGMRRWREEMERRGSVNEERM